MLNLLLEFQRLHCGYIFTDSLKADITKLFGKFRVRRKFNGFLKWPDLSHWDTEKLNNRGLWVELPGKKMDGFCNIQNCSEWLSGYKFKTIRI
jgi:hypothetical protein